MKDNENFRYLDVIIDNEATQDFENMTETEKEHLLMNCRDLADAMADAPAIELKTDKTIDIVAAMANTDVGNTVENSGIR